MNKGIFITGTGTDVGKTYVTGLLVKALREHKIDAGYFKAALSGAEEGENGALIPGDAAFVCKTARLSCDPASLVAHCYRTPVSPHLAAEWEGEPVDPARVRRVFDEVCGRFGFVVAEGSGGIFCPLRREPLYALPDVMAMTGFPLVVVAGAGLGTINNTLLTVEYARSRKLPVAGVVLNGWQPDDRMQQDNKVMIEALTGVPVLACVPQGAQDLTLTDEALAVITGQQP